MRFDQRIVAVVGARSGIAQACIRRMRAEGAIVLAVDESPNLPPPGPDGATAHLLADVTSAGGASEVAAYCAKYWGKLDVLLYAASAIDGAWQETAGDLPARSDWDRVFSRNVWGPMVYGRTLLPLLAQTQGSIVYLTSIDGILGNPGIPAYSSSKGALAILTHVLAHDGASAGVRVNAVATAVIGQFAPGDPGPVIKSDAMQRILAATPLRRAPTADDVAAVVAFYSSDDSAYVTGTVLPVDGGRTAITPGTLRVAE